MRGELRLANHLPVNNAYRCTIDRGVPVNSHCDLFMMIFRKCL